MTYLSPRLVVLVVIVACSATFTFASNIVQVGPNATAIWKQYSEGYGCFRIPALVTVPVVSLSSSLSAPSSTSDVLVAFAEGRKQLDCGDHGWNDIVMKYSLDGGRTWSANSVVYSESNATHKVTIGNPAPAVYKNQIFLVMSRNNQQVLWMKGNISFSSSSSSSSLQLSWSEPCDITSQVVGDGWKWVATGPPGAIFFPLDRATTRWLVPADHITGQNKQGSHTFYSDNFGQNWTMGQLLTIGNECQLARLKTGTIILNMRSQHLDSPRLFAQSTDNGQTFTQIQNATHIADPRCEGSMVATQTGDMLYMTNANNALLRINLTVHVSKDGRNWQKLKTIYEGASAYSSLSFLNNETILAIIWETGPVDPNQSISFTSLPLTSF